MSPSSADQQKESSLSAYINNDLAYPLHISTLGEFSHDDRYRAYLERLEGKVGIGLIEPDTQLVVELGSAPNPVYALNNVFERDVLPANTRFGALQGDPKSLEVYKQLAEQHCILFFIIPAKELDQKTISSITSVWDRIRTDLATYFEEFPIPWHNELDQFQAYQDFLHQSIKERLNHLAETLQQEFEPSFVEAVIDGFIFLASLPGRRFGNTTYYATNLLGEESLGRAIDLFSGRDRSLVIKVPKHMQTSEILKHKARLKPEDFDNLMEYVPIEINI